MCLSLSIYLSIHIYIYVGQPCLCRPARACCQKPMFSELAASQIEANNRYRLRAKPMQMYSELMQTTAVFTLVRMPAQEMIIAFGYQAL